MTRRFRILCAALALALAIALAGAGSALAAPAHPGRGAGGAQGGAVTTARPAAETGPASGNAGPATDDGGPSPIVPLVFAGIVILAAAGPWIAPRSRSTVYWVDRRW